MGEGQLTTEDCFICGVDRIPHNLGEVSGSINHAFSLDGKMERTTLRGSKPQAPRPVVMFTTVPAPDTALRDLLIAKGIINADELVEHVPAFTAKDLGLEA